MPASATHKANVCVLRLSLKDATHDNDRLNAACRLTQERLYIAIEGDWWESIHPPSSILLTPLVMRIKHPGGNVGSALLTVSPSCHQV